MVFSAVSGTAIGAWLSGAMTTSVALAPPVLIGSQGGLAAALGHAGGMQLNSSTLGTFGNSLNVTKQLYTLLKDVYNGTTSPASLAQGLTALTLFPTLGIFGAVTSVSVCVALLTLKGWISYNQASIGWNARAGNNGRNPYVDEYWEDMFDRIVDAVLNVGSVIANPFSIFSIVVANVVGKLSDGNHYDPAAVSRAYAGVPIGYTIITEGIRLVAKYSNNVNPGEVAHSMYGFLIGIPVCIGSVLSSIWYWNELKEKCHITKFFGKITDFMKCVGDVLRKFFLSVWKDYLKPAVRAVGRVIGVSAWNAVVPNPFRVVEDDNGAMVETPTIRREEPKAVADWFERHLSAKRHLTLCEQVQWSLPICTYPRSGALPNNSLLQWFSGNVDARTTVCWKSAINIPVNLLSLTTAQLASLLERFITNISIEGEVVVINRDHVRCTLEIGYNESYFNCFIRISFTVKTCEVVVPFYLVLTPPSESTDSNSSIAYLVAWQVTPSLLEQMLNSLVEVHPLIGALLQSKTECDIQEFRQATNHIMRWDQRNINFDGKGYWISWAVGKVIDWTAGWFGALDELKKSKFESNMVPDDWYKTPSQLTDQEWAVSCFHLLALYESGLQPGTYVACDPLADLPSNIFSGEAQLWRYVSSPGYCLADAAYMQMPVEGKAVKVQISRAWNENARYKSVSYGIIRQRFGVPDKNALIHLAYWAGLRITVGEKVRDRIEYSTSVITGNCPCSMHVGVCELQDKEFDDQIVIAFCQRHAGMRSVEEVDDPGTEYLMNKPLGGDIGPKLSQVLVNWNRSRAKEVAVIKKKKKAVVAGEALQKLEVAAKPKQACGVTARVMDYYASLKGKLIGDDVQHSNMVAGRMLFENLTNRFNRACKKRVSHDNCVEHGWLADFFGWTTFVEAELPPVIETIKGAGSLKTIMNQVTECYMRRHLDALQDKFTNNKTEAIEVLNSNHVPRGRFTFALGFEDATMERQPPHWQWLTDSVSPSETYKTDIRLEDMRRMLKRIDIAGSKISGKQWEEQVKRAGRYILPKRVDENRGAYASRAFFKMQQLERADPNFFGEPRTVLDPTAGYGGFAEYWSQRYYKNEPRVYLASTLVEPGHRPFEAHGLSQGSNTRVYSLTGPECVDRGNIKDERTRIRLYHETRRFRGIDLLLMDAGEYSNDLEVNKRFWLQAGPKELVSFLHATLDLQAKLLNVGGKFCTKINGVFEGVTEVVHQLSRHFNKVKAIKLATTPFNSTEWYLLCSGYDPNRGCSRARAEHLVNSIIDLIYGGLVQALHHTHTRGKGAKPRRWNGWLEPGTGGLLHTLKEDDSYPEGIHLKIPGSNFDEKWMPNWHDRIKLFERQVFRRFGRQRLNKSVSRPWSNVAPVGTIMMKQETKQVKNTANAFLSDATSRIWGLGLTNSTFCHTQQTSDWKEKSTNKRLDVSPGKIELGSLIKLKKAMDLLETRYSHSIKKKCRLLAKDEVLVRINNRGSTGLLDPGHNLKEYIDRNPDWYESALRRIYKWQNGDPTDTYFTVRAKNEPKKKKIVDSDGKFELKPGVSIDELEEHNTQGHRFIQFADAESRLAHYILLGDVIGRGGKTKLYKGTINGCPPMYQGKVMRALWDMASKKEDRVYDEGWNEESDVGIGFMKNMAINTGYNKLCGSGETMAANIDFSGWDGTVTAAERLLEADWLAGYYPDDLRSAIMNCCKEMAFAICVDDDGNVWVRRGQRGSGELLTSIGNTRLVTANTRVAFADATGLTLEEVCETVGEIAFDIGGEIKVIEITNHPQLTDGDDVYLVTSAEFMRLFRANAGEAFNRLAKSIRSGNTGGMGVCSTFEEIEFCSHSYAPVVIGPMARKVSGTGHQLKHFCLTERGYKLWYLPCRATADIFSRLRLTLKMSTTKWDPDDLEPDGCVAITRSKVLSYLLLYPHIRSVRTFCITVLAHIGDGSINWQEAMRRYSWNRLTNQQTGIGALKSVYKSTGLDDIGLMAYSRELKWMYALKYNVNLTGHKCRVRPSEYLLLMFKFLLLVGLTYPQIIEWDSSYGKSFCNYVVAHKLHLNKMYRERISTPTLSQWLNEAISENQPARVRLEDSVTVKMNLIHQKQLNLRSEATAMRAWPKLFGPEKV
uniref:Polyprotein n=1 Tax=Hymenopteran flavi-related virus TaxID=2822563 RepID=A0A8A6RQ02_9FLAV|nr:polyprotein [Hymenopteran flavi-related virus]